MSMNTHHNHNRRAKGKKNKDSANTPQSVKKKNTGLIIGIIVVVCLAAIALTLFILQAKQKESQVKVKEGTVNATDTTSSDSETGGKYITYNGQKYEYNRDIKTVLFLGVDKKGEIQSTKYPGEGGQSDSIILMAMNQKDKTVQLFQISRNTMTDVDVYNAKGDYLLTTKIQLTLQYAYGDGEKKSIWLTKKAVSNLMYGIPIDAAISMNIDGISAINDLIGGVTIKVPKDYTDIDPAFKEGSTITLTGEQAERYVRYRDITVTGSNNGRMERQTQFIMALMSQLKNGSKKDTELYSKLLTGANPYFVTDMSADEILALSEYEMNGDIQTIPGEEIAGESHDEFYVDENKLQEIVVKSFYKSKDM